jgi:hypothetical protein
MVGLILCESNVNSLFIHASVLAEHITCNIQSVYIYLHQNVGINLLVSIGSQTSC